MEKITTIKLLLAWFIFGLVLGCAAKPNPLPPDVMARKLANSEDFSKKSFGDSSQFSESDVGGEGRFSDIVIQESEAFSPGITTEGPESSLEKSSESGGIANLGDIKGQSSGVGNLKGEGSRSGGIGDFGVNLGEGLKAGDIGNLRDPYGGFAMPDSSRSGVSGSKVPSENGNRDSGSNGGKPYEPLDEVARLKPFEPTENLKDIHFEYDRYDLDTIAKTILDKNANWLKENLSTKVEIQGHCDERGTNNYNLGLGERRAIAVKKYLLTRGISKDRLFTISYGEERPFCQDATESCWKNNRRGHFLVSN